MCFDIVHINKTISMCKQCVDVWAWICGCTCGHLLRSVLFAIRYTKIVFSPYVSPPTAVWVGHLVYAQLFGYNVTHRMSTTHALLQDLARNVL